MIARIAYFNPLGGWLMRAKDIVGLLAGSVTVIAALLAAGTWWFNNFITRELDAVRAQLEKEIDQVGVRLTTLECLSANGDVRIQHDLDIKIAEDYLNRSITQMIQLTEINENGRGDASVTILLETNKNTLKNLPVYINDLKSKSAFLLDSLKGCGQ